MSTEAPNPVLVQMMNSGEFSDLKFVCHGEEFKVHKAIVCGQSPVIKAAVLGEFEESRTNVITMNEFQPSTVKRLVQFLYTGHYEMSLADIQASLENNDGSREGSPKIENQSDSEESKTGFESHAKFLAHKRRGLPHHLQKYVKDLIAPPNPMARASLIENIQVNSIGHYYDIGGLVSLANAKTKHLLNNTWRDCSWAASLPEATAAAMESTGDKQILDILASATVKGLSTFTDFDEFERLGVMTDFPVRVLKSCARKIKELEANQHDPS